MLNLHLQCQYLIWELECSAIIALQCMCIGPLCRACKLAACMYERVYKGSHTEGQ